MLFLIRQLTRELESGGRHVLIGPALVVFVFQAVPGPGAGSTWWMIDRLGFDQQFIATLSLIGSVLTLLGLFVFRRFMAEAHDFTNQRVRRQEMVDERQRAKNRGKSRIRTRVEHVWCGQALVRVQQGALPRLGQERHPLVRGAGSGQHLLVATVAGGMSAPTHHECAAAKREKVEMRNCAASLSR